MSLTDLWNTSPGQLQGKQVKQIIAFAGDGRLGDGSQASKEFRGYLALVPSATLADYADQCLAEKFPDSGFALQDVVNQLGRRLGFTVEDGRYRGSSSKIGFDGLWRSQTGHHVVVEVKTSSAFRVELDNIAGYRRGLVREGRFTEDESSILIVVGTEATHELEAQIRGSRHAWDIRLISVEGLKRLVQLKEELDDPATARRISEILIPYEYTRVDRIIDIVFATTEEALQDDAVEKPAEEVTGTPASSEHSTPVKFNDACAARVESVLERRLVKRSRTLFSSPDNSVGVISIVSKEHVTNGVPNYWYGFHEYQREALQPFSESFVAFGCGSPELVVLIPYTELEKWLPGMHATHRDDDSYRHVQIFREGDRLALYRKRGEKRIDVTKYLLPQSKNAR